jgi:redox-sensitive bicupin YhaK (pirin superfamily)
MMLQSTVQRNMNTIRRVQKVWRSTQTIEGAGVRLKRAFGYHQVPELDPFLLLDDFHSDNEQDYMAGFPWHPHRGIETITYMLHGRVEHGDSIGNGGIIQSNEVQWMTAGSGIIHQEMPKGPGLLWGFQLWANLPASQKMMDPRYRDVKANMIPVAKPANGVEVKVICGEVAGVRGPVRDIVIDPQCLDVMLDPGAIFSHTVQDEHNVFAYVVEGSGKFEETEQSATGVENVILFGKGNEVKVQASDGGVRFLLVSGRPLKEPVAWYGPIVMNTQEELRIAFEEYEKGTFIKAKKR